LIAKGEPQEEHLRELLIERAQLERQRQESRLEVLAGGIAHVKKLIAKGEPQEGHLQELLAEKARLEDALRKPAATGNEQDQPLVTETKAVQVTSSSVQQQPSLNVSSRGTMRIEAEVTADTVSDDVAVAAYKKQLLNEFWLQVGHGAISRIMSLSVDRWIGLEGVMAVAAYPYKSAELLKEAALEKREIGTATKFQTVANSHYRWADSGTWQFATLPGSAAFLFFSGSMWVVLLGMALFVIVLQLSEQFVFKLTANPLLCSLFGFTLANTIAQFGVAPRQDIPFYAMIVCFVLLVHAVQSEKIYGMVRKSINARNDRSAD
jgi:hypothetical protein